jgi:hypothetical protein
VAIPEVNKVAALQSLHDLHIIINQIKGNRKLFDIWFTDLIVKRSLHSSRLLCKTSSLRCSRVRSSGHSLARFEEFAREFLDIFIF